MVAKDLDVAIDQIIDFEFEAYDAQRPDITGLHREFLSSQRLDNMASSLCSLDALRKHFKSDERDNAEVSMIMLFDHEEVGSTSA